MMLQESSWCYPPDGAAKAMEYGVNSGHPYWSSPTAAVIAPQHAFRRPEPWGLAPEYLGADEADEIDEGG